MTQPRPQARPRLDRPHLLRERVPQTTLLALAQEWEDQALAEHDPGEDPYELAPGCRIVPPAPHAE